MRVLVTGASGFIGRHCLPLLQSEGYDEIHAVSSRDVSTLPGVRGHTANLLDPAEIVALLNDVRPTHLLHLAWYGEPGKYWSSPENFRWTRAGVELVKAFAECGGQRVVVAGTCAEYDWKTGGYYTEAHSTPAPSTVYGTCKHQLHVTLEALARQRGLSFAWGRIFFLYGPHEDARRLVPSVINSMLRGVPALCTHGRQVRDFLHVEDVASAFVALLASGVSGAVNIGSGVGVEVKSLVELIGKQMEREDLIRMGARPAPQGEPDELVADISRLRAETGWRARHTLDAGLAQTIAWWKGRLDESGSIK